MHEGRVLIVTSAGIHWMEWVSSLGERKMIPFTDNTLCRFGWDPVEYADDPALYAETFKPYGI